MKYAGVRSLFLFVIIFAPQIQSMEPVSRYYRQSFFEKINGRHIRELVTRNVNYSVRINGKRFFKKKGFGPFGKAVLFDPEQSTLSCGLYLFINHKKTKMGNWDVSIKPEAVRAPFGVAHAPILAGHQNLFGAMKSTRQVDTDLD